MKPSTSDRRILRLALPSIVSNITVPLLGLADVAIMGHVGGAEHIGAIAVGSMLFNVVYWLLGFLRMGTSGMTSQALGARRFTAVAAMLWRTLLTGTALGLAIVVMQVPLGRLSMMLMQPTPDVASMVWPYYNIVVWGAPAVLGLSGLNGWFVGMQDTRTPMLIAIGQNVFNIAVSMLLVFGCHMGIEGVALGTLSAQWAGLLCALLMLWRGYGRMLSRQRVRAVHLLQGMRRFFLVNADIFLRTLCLVSVNFYFTSAGAAQGALTLAANTLLMQFFMLFSYVMDGFAYAGEALCGRALGARDGAGLSFTVSRLFRWGWGVAVVFTVAYAGLGHVFLDLLTTDAHVSAAARVYLPWAVAVPLAGMAAFVWDGVFIGTTLTRGMLAGCLVGATSFFAICVMLSPSLGNHALWLALLVYVALRGLVQWLLWRRSVRGWGL